MGKAKKNLKAYKEAVALINDETLVLPKINTMEKFETLKKRLVEAVYKSLTYTGRVKRIVVDYDEYDAKWWFDVKLEIHAPTKCKAPVNYIRTKATVSNEDPLRGLEEILDEVDIVLSWFDTVFEEKMVAELMKDPKYDKTP